MVETLDWLKLYKELRVFQLFRRRVFKFIKTNELIYKSKRRFRQFNSVCRLVSQEMLTTSICSVWGIYSTFDRPLTVFKGLLYYKWSFMLSVFEPFTKNGRLSDHTA